MKKGLTFKFGLRIAALFLLWVSLGAYINFFQYEAMTSEEAQKDAQHLTRILAAPMAQYLQTQNNAGLIASVDSIFAEKGLAYFRVEDSLGAVVKEAGSAVDGDAVVTFTQPLEGGGQKLGTLTVGISYISHEKTMKSHMLWQLLAVALLGIVSLYVLISSFNRLVLVPIGSMNKMLQEMAAGGGDLTQRLDATSDDEIGELASNFNTFLGTLRELVMKVQDAGFKVLGLTGRIKDKSRSFISSAQEQVTTTNDNFRAIEKMDRSVQEVAGSAESLSITATDSSATVTEMAAQVDVVADSTMDLSGHVEETTSSISEMSASIKGVANEVRILADVASQTTDSVYQIELSIKDVERKAKESAAFSQEVSDDADTLGNEAIARTIEGMERIRETVDETSAVIEKLGARSVEIGQIVKVIDEVTNQTSLLALNAAILAAQAGEHGKGFDVVADEIKGLAERTSASTGEIARLIKSVQQESAAAVESMRHGRERVLEGTQMAYGASDALKKILESSNRSKETAMGIETATTQQVAAVRQVSEAIRNIHTRIQSIERATLEQSKGGELIAAAAEKINDIAKEVRRAMTEQARGIKEFARNLDETRDAVGTIADATRSQSEGSSRLVGSMEKILDSAENSSQATGDMEGAVSELLRQAETLRDEMGRFKV